MNFNFLENFLGTASLAALMLLYSCDKNNETPDLPAISVPWFSIDEGDVDHRTSEIEIELSHASANTIQLTWSTQDSSAHAGVDYVEVTGATVTFEPGETSKLIRVEILSDTIMEFTEHFIVAFEADDHAELTFPNTIITIQDTDRKNTQVKSDGYDVQKDYPGFKVEWEDNFDGSKLNDADWNYELGGGGWGNNELEIYTSDPQNVYAENGILTIRAIDEGSKYTSARLTTQNKRVFKFGLIEIKAKLPEGQGIWPALWMLGTNISSIGWPGCGEIDIMELVGHLPGQVHGTAHYNSNGHQYSGNSYALGIPDTFSKKYHVFSILWENDRIAWYVDYQLFYEITSEMTGSSWPFNNSFFFIFNLAVGGNWPGYPDETTIFPQSMLIDYIRVYKPE
ncbi:MAG TPA: family 16 glycosylhydrolase [Cyclobacteriaceae bacterium]|nr:family 16 glycosylhydrolase [Cyclobacteriaceae bacterium]